VASEVPPLGELVVEIGELGWVGLLEVMVGSLGSSSAAWVRGA
jgi:hypothetical protein